MNAYDQFTSLYSRNLCNIVKHLYFNKISKSIKIKKKKKKCPQMQVTRNNHSGLSKPESSFSLCERSEGRLLLVLVQMLNNVKHLGFFWPFPH